MKLQITSARERELEEEIETLKEILRSINKHFSTKRHIDQAEFELIKSINEVLNPQL